MALNKGLATRSVYRERARDDGEGEEQRRTILEFAVIIAVIFGALLVATKPFSHPSTDASNKGAITSKLP